MRLVLLVILAVAAQAQVRVSGVVVDKAGNPVRAAIVGFGGLRYPTEADGTFEFRDVRPGGYAFSVQRTGFAPLSGAPFLEVGDQPITGVRLVMTKHSVITGRVTDAEGDPAVGVPVEVLERDYDRGVRTMVPRARVDTDDRGIYRAANLPPGSYWVRAAGSPRSYPRQSTLTIGPPQVRAVDTYYPSALEERDAQRLTLPEDTELINTDIRLRDATPFTIRGQLIDAVGQPIAWQGMTILPDRPLAGLYDTEQSLLASRRTRDDGGFEFHNLAPGRYWVVTPSGSNSWIGFGRTLVTVVNDDVNDVVVQARTGPSVTVVVEMENGEEPPTGLDVWLIEDGLKLASQLQKTKKREPLVYESVFPTSYRIDMRNLPPELYVKSIHLGDADVTRQLFDIDRPETLRIVLSNRPGAIWGKLRPDARVVLWPREPHPEWTALGVWPISTDQNGEFAFGGVDPGNYLLVALETVPGHADTAYEFVDRFRDVAVPVEVTEGAKLTVEAPLVPAARTLEEFAKLP